MELYKFILTDNDSNTVHECIYLPENMLYLRIKRDMKMEIPLGFNYSASLETIRLIKEDAEFIYNIWKNKGVNSDIACELQYLNAMATGYDTVFTGKIDVEGDLKVTTMFVECGIVISHISDKWNEKSGVDISLPYGNNRCTFPSMRLYNLLNVYIGTTVTTRIDYTINPPNPVYISTRTQVIKDINSQIFSLSVITNNETFTSNGTIIIQGNQTNWTHNQQNVLTINNNTDNIRTVTLYSQYKPDDNNNAVLVYRIYNGTTPVGSEIPLGSNTTINIPVGNRLIITIGNQYTNASGNISIGFFIDDANTLQFTAPILTLDEVLATLTSNRYNYVRRNYEIANHINYGILSGDMACGFSNAVATIKPADLIKDFCIIMGYGMYFDRDGIMQLKPIEQLIGTNIHRFDEIKDIEFQYCEELLYTGLEVGYNIPATTYSLGRQQFAEKLTFSSAQLGGDNLLSLVPSKLRIDYAGLLLTRFDYQNSVNKGQQNKEYKDVWLVQIDELINPFVPMTRDVTTVNIEPSGAFNVFFSPRRIPERWATFLSTVFAQWSGGTAALALSAQENISNQLQSIINWPNSDWYFITEKSDVSLMEQQAQFIPIEVSFTTIGNISDIYTFDKVEFDYNGNTYQAIVKEVTTAGRIEELEIKALLTQKLV
jgi:hypothetical protein